MKNILVPTDLSQHSLDTIRQVVDKNSTEPVNIFLVHMVKAPTELSDLLFLKKSRLYDHVPNDFFRSIDNFKNAYPKKINSIRFEFYYGHRAGILKSIVESLEIDEICILDGYTYQLPLEGSVNMVPFIDRCMVPVFKAAVYGKVVLQGAVKKSPSFPVSEYSSVLQ